MTAVAVALAGSLLKGSRRNTAHFACVVWAWVSSFIILYLCQLQNLVPMRMQLELYPGDAYLPHTLVGLMQWAPRMMDQFNRRALGLAIPASYLIAVGIVLLGRRRRRDTFVLAFPLVPVLILSCSHLYPMVGRFLLFLVPMAFVFIAGALSVVPNRMYMRVAVGAAILAFPLFCQFRFLFHPRCIEDARTACQYVRKNWHQGDCLFVFAGSANAFQYYSQLYSWDWSNVIVGTRAEIDDPNWHEEILKTWGGKHRVWVLASHRLVGLDQAPWYASMIRCFDSSGALLHKQEYFDAEARLYDLARPERRI
jgi:hypothetical protein